MNDKTYIKILTFFLLVTTTTIIIGSVFFVLVPKNSSDKIKQKNTSNFYYIFNVNEVLEETNSMDKSPSPYWWINSGGYLTISNVTGKTPNNEEPADSKWRVLYAENNPLDTDNGYHPQNLFRMLTKSKWQNFRQEMYFKINKYNTSSSENRNLSNGMFLLSRYKDENNTYYIGLRVDGNAIIKKKINGKYFTLAEKKVVAGKSYDRETNPIIIPQNIWVGIRGEIQNAIDGSVVLEMSMDIDRTGVWSSILQVKDDGSVGGQPILESGFSGIRTDFMDAEFSDYSNIETKATVF